jgi:hypothetical protein
MRAKEKWKVGRAKGTSERFVGGIAKSGRVRQQMAKKTDVDLTGAQNWSSFLETEQLARLGGWLNKH